MTNTSQLILSQNYINFSFNGNFPKKKKNDPNVKLLILTENIFELFKKNPKILTWFLSYLNTYRPFNILFYNIEDKCLSDMLKLFNNFSIGIIYSEKILNKNLNNYLCQQFLLYSDENILIENEKVQKIHIKSSVTLKEFVQIITEINSTSGQMNEHTRPS